MLVRKILQKRLLIKTTRSKVKTAENFLLIRGYREPTGIYTPSKLNEILKGNWKYFIMIRLILSHIYVQVL